MKKDPILKRIRGKIRNYKNLDYVISCFERRKEIAFFDYARHQSCDVVLVENNQQKAKEGIIYYIKSGNKFSGFGAEFRRTIDALYFADHFGYIPVIEYTPEYIYFEDDPVDGITNPFEYYFLQPSNYMPSDISRFAFVRFCEEHRKKIHNMVAVKNAYELSAEYIEAAGKIVKKYMQLNDKTQKYIAEAISEYFKDDFAYIGVHYRGTDFKDGYKRHPYALEVQDFLPKIDELLLNVDKPAKIFVASDEKKAIDFFVQRYGEKVLYFKDVFRSEKGEPIHFSKSERKMHKYNLGLEVLRDIVSLARCEYLVAGLSQVSYSARIIKASRNSSYKDILIISKGIKQ